MSLEKQNVRSEDMKADVGNYVDKLMPTLNRGEILDQYGERMEDIKSAMGEIGTYVFAKEHIGEMQKKFDEIAHGEGLQTFDKIKSTQEKIKQFKYIIEKFEKDYLIDGNTDLSDEKAAIKELLAKVENLEELEGQLMTGEGALLN